MAGESYEEIVQFTWDVSSSDTATTTMLANVAKIQESLASLQVNSAGIFSGIASDAIESFKSIVGPAQSTFQGVAGSIGVAEEAAAGLNASLLAIYNTINDINGLGGVRVPTQGGGGPAQANYGLTETSRGVWQPRTAGGHFGSPVSNTSNSIDYITGPGAIVALAGTTGIGPGAQFANSDPTSLMGRLGLATNFAPPSETGGGSDFQRAVAQIQSAAQAQQQIEYQGVARLAAGPRPPYPGATLTNYGAGGGVPTAERPSDQWQSSGYPSMPPGSLPTWLREMVAPNQQPPSAGFIESFNAPMSPESLPTWLRGLLSPGGGYTKPALTSYGTEGGIPTAGRLSDQWQSNLGGSAYSDLSAQVGSLSQINDLLQQFSSLRYGQAARTGLEVGSPVQTGWQTNFSPPPYQSPFVAGNGFISYPPGFSPGWNEGGVGVPPTGFPMLGAGPNIPINGGFRYGSGTVFPGAGGGGAGLPPNNPLNSFIYGGGGGGAGGGGGGGIAAGQQPWSPQNIQSLSQFTDALDTGVQKASFFDMAMQRFLTYGLIFEGFRVGTQVLQDFIAQMVLLSDTQARIGFISGQSPQATVAGFAQAAQYGIAPAQASQGMITGAQLGSTAQQQQQAQQLALVFGASEYSRALIELNQTEVRAQAVGLQHVDTMNFIAESYRTLPGTMGDYFNALQMGIQMHGQFSVSSEAMGLAIERVARTTNQGVGEIGTLYQSVLSKLQTPATQKDLAQNFQIQPGDVTSMLSQVLAEYEKLSAIGDTAGIQKLMESIQGGGIGGYARIQSMSVAFKELIAAQQDGIPVLASWDKAFSSMADSQQVKVNQLTAAWQNFLLGLGAGAPGQYFTSILENATRLSTGAGQLGEVSKIPAALILDPSGTSERLQQYFHDHPLKLSDLFFGPTAFVGILGGAIDAAAGAAGVGYSSVGQSAKTMDWTGIPTGSGLRIPSSVSSPYPAPIENFGGLQNVPQGATLDQFKAMVADAERQLKIAGVPVDDKNYTLLDKLGNIQGAMLADTNAIRIANDRIAASIPSLSGIMPTGENAVMLQKLTDKYTAILNNPQTNPTGLGLGEPDVTKVYWDPVLQQLVSIKGSSAATQLATEEAAKLMAQQITGAFNVPAGGNAVVSFFALQQGFGPNGPGYANPGSGAGGATADSKAAALFIVPANSLNTAGTQLQGAANMLLNAANAFFGSRSGPMSISEYNALGGDYPNRIGTGGLRIPNSVLPQPPMPAPSGFQTPGTSNYEGVPGDPLTKLFRDLTGFMPNAQGGKNAYGDLMDLLHGSLGRTLMPYTGNVPQDLFGSPGNLWTNTFGGSPARPGGMGGLRIPNSVTNQGTSSVSPSAFQVNNAISVNIDSARVAYYMNRKTYRQFDSVRNSVAGSPNSVVTM